MAITKPDINVQFQVLANNFVERTNNKKAVLIIKDDTVKTFNKKIYIEKEDLLADSDLYLADNLQACEDCFVNNGIAQLTVIRIDATDGAIADALTLVGTCETESYVGVYSSTQADHTALANWIKQQASIKKFYNAICFNLSTAADDRHVINFTNPKVKFADASRGEVTGDKYIPSLIGYIAGRNAQIQSPTYQIMDNLESVTEVSNVDTSIANGELVLFNDGNKVRIVMGVNNKKTVATNENEDMKLIEYSEVMDQINDDINNTYKDFYVGKYKDKNDHREILVSAINDYFGDLENDDILNSDFDNVCMQNIDKMKTFLKSNGVDITGLTDAQVKLKNFGRSVFIKSNIQILESMCNLEMDNILN